MTNSKVSDSSLEAALRRRLEQVRNDATSAARNFTLIAEAINEVLDRGGKVNIDPQVTFLTGAHARLTKAHGMVTFLQNLGFFVKKPPPTR